MDYFERNREQESGIFKMEVDDTAKSFFLEMARWTKFMSILGFIFMALIILGAIGISIFLANSNTPFAGMGATGIATIYLVLVAIEIYPIYALYQYSVLIKKALLSTNKEQFNKAVNYLKRMFKYLGIMAIITIALYGVAIIAVGMGMAMKHGA